MAILPEYQSEQILFTCLMWHYHSYATISKSNIKVPCSTAQSFDGIYWAIPFNSCTPPMDEHAVRKF